MAHMMLVTPMDEEIDGKLVVYPPMLVGAALIRKIVDSSFIPEPAKPAVAKDAGTGAEKEPLAAPAASVAPPVMPLVARTTIVFMDGKELFVKEPIAAIQPMVA